VKHVAIDARMIQNSGVGRFLRQVLSGLIRDNRFRLTLLGDPALLGTYARDDGHVSVVQCSAGLYSLREQIELPRQIPPCDLLYVPHYVTPLLYRGPLVVAVNDLIHLERRDFAPSIAAQWYAKVMIRAAVQRARRIVTLSAYSRDRLVQLTGAPRERFEVVYPSVDSNFFQPVSASRLIEVRERYRLHAPYLLFVGSAKPHKNLSTLIRAFDLVRRNHLQHQLVIVGQFSGIRSNIKTLDRLVAQGRLREQVRFLGLIPDTDLPAVYAAADVFVFPSLAEGFGLPPLEAMACGTPVVAAHTTAVPEACGDAAAYYVAAEDPDGLAEVILSLMCDSTRRAQLVALGRNRARLFAGSARTRQMLELLHDA
jgi:glycosyltransferase involved in cell wall biosynthesis